MTIYFDGKEWVVIDEDAQSWQTDPGWQTDDPSIWRQE